MADTCHNAHLRRPSRWSDLPWAPAALIAGKDSPVSHVPPGAYDSSVTQAAWSLTWAPNDRAGSKRLT